MPSFVWDHFTKLNEKKSKCNFPGCGAILMYAKGTRSLIYHLKTHNILQPSSVKRPNPDSQQNPVKRQKLITDYSKKQSIEEEIARMASESNFSFNQIATTKFIRESLAIKYPNSTVPKQAKQVAEMLMKFFDYAQNQVKEKICELKESGKKFSATIDEWTSVGNARYLNINLHYATSSTTTSYFDLGLLKITGTCKAPTMKQIVSKNLTF